MEGTSTTSSTNPPTLHSTLDTQSQGGQSNDSEQGSPPRWLLCWHILSWSFSILTYIAEGFAIVWVVIHYANFELYTSLGITLGCFVVAGFVLAIISLFWYYDLDRYCQKQLLESGPFPERYKRKCTIIAVFIHTLLLGEIYRYGELIFNTVIGQFSNLKLLHRDATLLRFFHGFVITAPQIIIHLYAITVATDSSHKDTDDYRTSEQVIFALCACVVSLSYSVLTYATSDRLSSKTRRVILPAHFCLVLWYVCLIVPRILALTLFTHAYGYYVLVFIGFHWVLSVLGILNQKSEFCADYSGDRKKRRWVLEVLFSLFAACAFQFVYFNVKEGDSRYAVSVYLVITLIENVIMIALFYASSTTLWYAPASIAIVAGLFLLGVLLMLVYYLVLHPNRTKDWYWVGVPRSCCKFGKKSGSYRPHNVEISGPTLVTMNGHAPNLQSRMTGLQPLNSLLSRNKTTGSVHLMDPPRVIESGLPRSETESHKPRIIPPTHQPVVTTHTLPIAQSPSSNLSTEGPATASEMARVAVLTIPTSASLGSSGPTESDGTGTGQPAPTESDMQVPSQTSMGLHIDVESAFQASAALNAPNVGVSVNANASNANESHDNDIDSPITSPYDTLEKSREEAEQFAEKGAAMEGREREGARASASPASLPTPDLSNHSTLPDSREGGAQEYHEPPQPHPQPHPQPQPQPHQQRFRDIPAKKDYHVMPSRLEQHYFPEGGSTSTPNIPQVTSTAGAGENRGALLDGNVPHRGGSVQRHRSLPPSESTKIAPQGKNLQSHQLHQQLLPAASSWKPVDRQHMTYYPGHSPERTRAFSHSGSAQRHNKRRGGANRSPKQERGGAQSYYAYSSTNGAQVGRPHSYHVPQQSPEQRRKLHSHNSPWTTVTPNAPVNQSPHQPLKNVQTPVTSSVPPDHSRADRYQSVPASRSDARPRSFSEGTELSLQKMNDQSLQRHKSVPDKSSDALTHMGTQGPPQHYPSRSPGAPRRGPQPNFYAPSDRTQVLNLTWTSPRLHHDPAISGQARPRAKTAYEHSPMPLANSPPVHHNRRGNYPNVKMARGGGGPVIQPSRSNPLQPGGQENIPVPRGQIHPKYGMGSPQGARRPPPTQQGRANPLLHVPTSTTHTSRV